MATGRLPCSGVSEHRYRWFYDIEESHIASLDCFEESLSFALDSGRFCVEKSHQLVLNIW